MNDQDKITTAEMPREQGVNNLIAQVKRMLEREAYHYCGDCHTHCRQTIMTVEALKESERLRGHLATLLRNAGHPRIPKGEESKRRACWCNTSLYCTDEPNCIATRAALTETETK